MATAVGVMDQPGLDANTDVLVLVEPRAELLLWIPRDLWCPMLGRRVNRAFAIGGHEGLAGALAEHGIEIQHSLCLERRVSERVLEAVTVEVPVAERIELWYPLDPHGTIEDGRREVSFEPPSEVLSGERVHQWIGARYPVGQVGSDLRRIARQQVLVKALLAQGFDFATALEPAEEIALSDPLALEELAAVRAGWTFSTFGDDAVEAEIDGMAVLVR